MVQAVTPAVPSYIPTRDAAQGAQQSASGSQAQGGQTTANAAPVAAPFALSGDPSGAASKALQKMLAPLIPADAHLAISQDEFISRFIYKFVDPLNGKTLRQYPQQMVIDSLHTMEAGVQRFLDEHV